MGLIDITPFVASAVTTAHVVALEGRSRGMIVAPAALNTADITFQVSARQDTNFRDAYKSDGSTVIKITGAAAGRAYTFPAELFGAAYVKMVLSVGQAAAREFVVTVE